MSFVVDVVGSVLRVRLRGELDLACVELFDSLFDLETEGIDTVVLTLDQDEEVRLTDDRKGGAVISQPYRPDSTVALPKRSLGELIGEEMKRLDSDEPYREALEAATGVTGLDHRPPVREHRWLDPMRPAQPAPTVPADSVEDDEVAQTGTGPGDDDGGDDLPGEP